MLNELTVATANIYGDVLEPEHGDDDLVLVPGIVRGRETGQICVALLTLDLSSSGEHWGTDFLTCYGVIPQSPSDDEEIEERAMADLRRFMPYDYGYSVHIPNDIHVDNRKLPKDMKAFLADYSGHSIDLPHKSQEPGLQEEDSEDQEI